MAEQKKQQIEESQAIRHARGELVDWAKYSSTIREGASGPVSLVHGDRVRLNRMI